MNWTLNKNIHSSGLRSQAAVIFFMGFSLLSASEFLPTEKGDVRNKKPPAMRVVQSVLIAPNHLSCIIEVSKPLLQERKGDLYGQ